MVVDPWIPRERLRIFNTAFLQQMIGMSNLSSSSLAHRSPRHNSGTSFFILRKLRIVSLSIDQRVSCVIVGKMHLFEYWVTSGNGGIFGEDLFFNSERKTHQHMFLITCY
jgi:hypothetical protein